ncbi:MAG: glycoside hydrolase family 95-like protein [Acidobacteriota bacterium]
MKTIPVTQMNVSRTSSMTRAFESILLETKLTRRGFLGTLTATPALKQTSSPVPGQVLDALTIARQHPLVRVGPTPNFFEGMLLGNGDVGVCVTVRPDALGLHLGKEDSWDIRVSEDHYQHVLPFKELLELWQRASDEAKRQGKPEQLFLEREIDFFHEYTKKVESSYRKSWPRPWPSGTVWIHWDARYARVKRQTLDISRGVLTLDLDQHDLNRGRLLQVVVFVSAESGHVSVSTETDAPFLSVAYYPHLEPEAMLPPPELEAESEDHEVRFTAYQHFPAVAPGEHRPDPAGSKQDRNFSLCGLLKGKWVIEGLADSQAQLRQMALREADTYTRYAQRPRVFCRSLSRQPLRFDLTLVTPRDHPDTRTHSIQEARRLAALPVVEVRRTSEQHWKEFWSKSAVSFADKELERIWYHNQYFLACCLKPGKVAPGLFGNWMSGKIGTAWHGDYHMNYNTQQVYWGVFSSNHVEQHLPYVELCENLLGYSEAYAKENFKLPGAFFPHTAYPVPSQTIPYPVPPWGYEICETPWTVQSLWWHYRYTLDRDFLARVYPLLRAAALFLAAYVSKGEDGKYHIVPTVSPENWGFTVDFRLNKDCIIDLALTEFLLDAILEASRVLDRDSDQRAGWQEIREHLTSYPTAHASQGEVWVDVVEAPSEVVYNVPVTLAPVFPGEQVGIGLRPELRQIAERTARAVRLEGGNDLVFQPLIRARLGMLDLDWFKQEVRYCLLPNGTCGDRVRQIGGRYKDSTHFDFMMNMGIWIENLSLPAVINECLLQSYTGVLRLFPNTLHLGQARFRDLRAVGAFLVTADHDGTQPKRVELHSEKGAECRLAHPWGTGPLRVVDVNSGRSVETRLEGDILTFSTQAGRRYRIERS